jgi:hypothetical protein
MMAVTDKVRCPQCGTECPEQLGEIPARLYPDPEPPDVYGWYWCEVCQKTVFDPMHRNGNLVPYGEDPDYSGEPEDFSDLTDDDFIDF